MAITNLTGTTWKFDCSTITIDLSEFFSIDGTLTAGGYSATSVSGEGQLILRNGWSLTFPSESTKPYFYCNVSTDPYLRYYKDDSTNFTVDTNCTLYISGGADVTNASLISWLETNGELQSVTIKAGAYRFNDVLTPSVQETITQSINFTVSFTDDYWGLGGNTIIHGVCSKIFYSNIQGDLGYTFDSTVPDLSSYDLTYPFELWMHGGGGWCDELCKTITILEDTEVDEAFYTWFIANTTTTMTLSGIWLFNETLEPTDAQTVSLSFNAKNYPRITQIGLDVSTNEDTVTLTMTYTQTQTDILGDYSNTYTAYSSTSGWSISRRVELTSEQQVPIVFYEWFTANAVDITDKVTYVDYNGEHIGVLQDGEGLRLPCKDVVMIDDVSITTHTAPVLVEKEITANGEYPASTDGAGGYSKVVVNVESSGGECSGNHVIEVDELPTENIDESAVYFCDGSYHKYSAQQITDLVVSIPDNDVVAPIHELFEADASLFNYIYVKTKPTENIMVSGETGFYIYYVEEEDNVFFYGDVTNSGVNEWLSVGTFMALPLNVQLPFNGFVSDETLASELGLYAIGGSGWKTYTVPKGEMTITENGEYNVAGLKTIVADVPNAVMNGVWTIVTDDDNWYGYSPFECNVNCTLVYNDELKLCVAVTYRKDSKNRPHLDFYTAEGEEISPVDMSDWNDYVVSPVVDFGLEPQIVPASLRAMFDANATRQESGVSDEVLTITPSTEKQVFNDGVYYKNVVVDAIQTQPLEVGVAATDTTYTPDDGKFFSSVKVKAADISDPSTLHQLCGISLKSFPKTRYVDGDSFISVIGGVLCCCYTDGSTVDVNLQYDMVRNLDIWSGVGTRIATVEYTEGGITCQTTYLYTVTDGTEPDNPLPIEIRTEPEMDALLATAEVGSVYKYTGTSGTYENGALYIVEAVNE